MCGIVGSVGDVSCKSFLLDGLTRLEYRGYDSAGISCIGADGRLTLFKRAGSVGNLSALLKNEEIDGTAGIGHTRWATHGPVDDLHAHPHLDQSGRLSMVHNGIFENAEEVRSTLLAKDSIFRSSTDTEVGTHLLGHLINEQNNVRLALRRFAKYVNGSYALVALTEDEPNSLLIVRRRSPLVIGLGDDFTLVGSDPCAFHGRTKRVVFVPDNSYGLVTANGIELYGFDGNPLEVRSESFELTFDPASKGIFEHFMLKEIHEQPVAIEKTVSSICRLSKDDFWSFLGTDSKSVAKLNSLMTSRRRWRSLGLSILRDIPVCISNGM